MYKKLPAVFDEGTPLAFYRGVEVFEQKSQELLVFGF